MANPHVNLNQFLAPAKQFWNNAKGFEVLSLLALAGIAVVAYQNIAARTVLPSLPLPFAVPYLA